MRKAQERVTAVLTAALAAVVVAAAPASGGLAAQQGHGAGHGGHGAGHGADGPAVLRAARMIDVETGAVHADAVLVIENGLIAAVNPASVPEAAHDMDLGT